MKLLFVPALLAALILFASAQDTGQSKYITKIVTACVGEVANLTCPEGSVIAVQVANFGRFSLKVCPRDPDNPEEIVGIVGANCQNPASLPVLQNSCNGHRECLQEVSTYVFSGCEDAVPYLEVTYICKEVTTTTSTTTTTTTTTPAPRAKSASDREKDHRIDNSADRRSHDITPPVLAKCPARSYNGVEYPSAFEGNIVKTSCIDQAKGESWWECGQGGHWIGEYPNTTMCFSDWTIVRRQFLDDVRKRRDGSGISEFLRILHQDTNRPMQAGDLQHLLRIFKEIVDMLTRESWAKHARQLCNARTVEVVDDIITAKDIWPSVPVEKRRQMASELLGYMEKILALSEETGVVPQRSVFIQISDPIQSMRNSSPNMNYIDFPSSPIASDSVDVPIRHMRLSQNDATESIGPAKILFTIVRDISPNFKPRSIYRPAEDNQGGEIVERVVVSDIVSVSVIKGGHKLKDVIFDSPMFITFVHPEESVRNYSRPECNYWNEDKLRWDASGCDLQKHNSTHTVCACSHMTYFALIMDVRGHELSLLDNQLMTFLTYFGCSLSIVCLILTFLCFMCFSKGGGDRVFIHKNLCLMLALAELVFLLGVWRTDNKLVCSLIAGGLLYLFLSALTWMLLEGYQLYQMLVEVFPTGSRKWIFTLIGYGFPAIITGVAAYFDPNGFGTKDHCWLRTENNFIMVFVIPAAIILALNTVFLVMTLFIVCKHTSGGYLPCRHESDTGRNVKSWVKGSMSISCLLGVTWTLGLLWVDDDKSIYMAYAFTITNSLQGLVIFLFHVVFSEKMRKDISRWFNRRGCCVSSGSTASPERRKGSLPRGALSPSGGSGSATGSEFLYPSSEKYHTSPRGMDTMMSYGQPAHMHEYQPQIPHQGTYDYATISYGEMMPGMVGHGYRGPPSYRIPPGSTRSPEFRTYGGSVYRDQVYMGHRPPPEFSPPPPPPMMNEAGVPRALIYAARRPPSSKMSDDSAYSEGHSSMLATEVTPSGATVLRMDLGKNPPVFRQDL